jgi:hypothetical protein
VLVFMGLNGGKPSAVGRLRDLFGGKPAEAGEPMPDMDVEGGLNRALRAAAAGRRASRQDDMETVRQALAAIEAALFTLDTIRDAIEQAYEVVLSAQEIEDAGGRALLAESYDELRQLIAKTVDEVDSRAGQLIGKSSRNLDLKLGEKAHYSVSATRFDLSSKGLCLDPPREAFATFEEIARVLGELDSAVKKADLAAASYCRDAQFLIGRLNAKTQEDEAACAKA